MTPNAQMTEARFYESLGRRIRAARKKRGITQEALARALRPPVVRTQICHIEAGNSGMPAYRLAQIAQALGVGVQALCGDGT